MQKVFSHDTKDFVKLKICVRYGNELDFKHNYISFRCFVVVLCPVCDAIEISSNTLLFRALCLNLRENAKCHA
jgi:hypothetical protein